MDEQRIIQQYYELRSCRAVAEEYGCSQETVRRVLQKNGVNRTGWKQTPEYKLPPKKYHRKYKPYEPASYELTCKYCGKTFTAHRKDNKYCSRTCKDIVFRKNHGIPVNHNPEPFVKKCEVCGTEFLTRREKSYVCSHECALIREDQKRKIKKIQKTCDICGKTFFTNHDSQMTCGSDKCKSEHRRIAHKKRNERAKANKELRLITYEIRECVECGELFTIDDKRNNKCCSKECSKKRENRKKDKRIPKNQIVDSDISIQRLFKRDKGICWICGEKCDFNSTSISKKGNIICGDLYPEIEHVIPISRGGLHSWDNVRLAHRKCNQLKSDNLFPFVPLDKEFAYKEKRKGRQSKRTAQYTLEGELVKIWESTAAIEREHKEWKCKHIQNVCRGDESRTGNAYGYHWEYIKDDKCE